VRRVSRRRTFPESISLLGARIEFIAFAGAAFYINFAEHSARLALDDKSLAQAVEAKLGCGLHDAGKLGCRVSLLGFLAAWLTF
jgi:hypothetical protein